MTLKTVARPLPTGAGRTILVREDTGHPMLLRVATRPAQRALGRTKLLVGFGRKGTPSIPLIEWDLEAN